MCDYSLSQHRVAAKVGDELVSTKFDFLTRGLLPSENRMWQWQCAFFPAPKWPSRRR